MANAKVESVKQYKATSLPTQKIPNAIIWVRETPTSDIKGYISDVVGNYFPLKDLMGGGNQVTNVDGSITIVTLPNSTQISVSTTLKNLINSSLQPGDNISELVNDANYATESYVDSKIVQTIANGDTTHSPSADVIYDKLLLKQNLPTGFVAGLELSIHPTDNTKAIIAPGGYVITDFTDVFNVQAVPVQILTPIEFTPAYLNTSPSTYVALDINGSIVSQATPFDNSQRRTLCLIGNVVHSNLTNINVVNEIKAPILAPTNQLHDLIKAVGFLNLEGNLFSANGANLSLNKSAGRIWGLGINGGDYLDPHRLTLPGLTALTFRYRLSVSPVVEFSDTNILDPTLYEPNGGGILVPLSNNNRWSIQHINIFQSGAIRIQPGQHEYSSFVSARNAAFTENFVTEQNIADNAIFRAYIIMKKTCTNLQLDITNGEAEIIHIGKFGNAVGGSNASLTLGNILAVLGYTPENEANKQNSFLIDGTGQKYYTVDYTNNNIVPNSRTLTIDGVSYDLSANRSWIISKESVITRKTITYLDLFTQDLAGFLTYINNTTPFTINRNEHVIYEVTDTGQKFIIYKNNINVGLGETSLLISEIGEIFPMYPKSEYRSFTIINSGTTFSNSGSVTAGSFNGTHTALGRLFFGIMASKIVSSAAIGSIASYNQLPFNTGIVINGNPKLKYKHETFFSIANVVAPSTSRCYFGLVNFGFIGSTNINPSTQAMIGFGNDSTDSNLQLMTIPLSGIPQKIDLGANFPARYANQTHIYQAIFELKGNYMWDVYLKDWVTGNIFSLQNIEASTVNPSGFRHIIYMNNNTTAEVVEPIIVGQINKIIF